MLQAAQDSLVDGFLKMFYLVSPYSLALDETDAMPNWLLVPGIPMFFVFMIIEYIIMITAKPKALDSFRIKDAIMCTCIGATQQAFEVFVECVGLTLTVSVYSLAYRHCRIGTVDVKEYVWTSYFALLLGKDLGYTGSTESSKPSTYVVGPQDPALFIMPVGCDKNVCGADHSAVVDMK